MSDHFTSSDDDLEEYVALLGVPKNTMYFEEIVPQYDDQLYRAHFRVSRNVAEDIAERFGLSEYFKFQRGDSLKITPMKFITVFLWFCGNESASFRDVADRFDISKSSLHKIIKRVTYFLSNLSPEIIVWPTTNEKVIIERHFRENGFPGVIGVIDGTHVKIDKPKDDPDSYLNRKHFFSVQAQVVCDHRRKIRDIFVGFPGSVHDSRVFRQSPLSDTLPGKCEDFFIIGDSGYPCSTHLLTPFRDRGQLTRRQRNYNYLLSKNRYIVEHCFGVMKQKFRQLYHLKLRKMTDIVHFIRACAVLHNISIDDEFVMNVEEILLDNEDEIDEYVQDVNLNVTARRDEIMNALPVRI